MVLKKSKSEAINSGNTIRKGRSKTHIRAFEIQASKHNFLKYADKHEKELYRILSQPQIEFSLNKQNRWSLYEKLEKIEELQKTYGEEKEKQKSRRQLKKENRKNKRSKKRRNEDESEQAEIVYTKSDEQNVTVCSENKVNFKSVHRTLTKLHDAYHTKHRSQKVNVRKPKIYYDDDLTTDYLSYDYDEDDDYDDYDEDDVIGHQTSVSFSDYFNTSHETKKAVFVEESIGKSVHGEIKPVMQLPYTSSGLVGNTRTVELPIQLQVKSSSIAPEILRQKHGKKYHESASIPRKFLIIENASYKKAKVVMVTVRSESKGVASVLIDKQQSHGNKDLNIPYTDGCINFDELIQPVFDLQSNFTNSSHTIVSPYTVLKPFTLHNVFTEQNRNPAMLDTCFVDDNLCQNCFQTKDSFTTLMGCGHTFCDECWQDFISMMVSAQRVNIPCMQYKCNTRIDPVTVVSFLKNDKSWLSFKSGSLNSITSCPKKHCVGVTSDKVNPPRTSEITDRFDAKQPEMFCEVCRSKFCVYCREGHWPLTCEMHQAYQEYKSGEEQPSYEDLLRDSQYLKLHLRSCPNCHVVIEKNGGCNHMYCTQCYKPFNWDKPQTKEFGTWRFFQTKHNDRLRNALLVGTVIKNDAMEKLKQHGYTNEVKTKLHTELYEAIKALSKIVESAYVVSGLSDSVYQRRRYLNLADRLKWWVSKGLDLLSRKKNEYDAQDIKYATRKMKELIDQVVKGDFIIQECRLPAGDHARLWKNILIN